MEDQKQQAYKMYVTDTLRLVGENTAKQVRGAYIAKRYSDLIKPIPEDNRTPEEIIAQIRSKL